MELLSLRAAGFRNLAADEFEFVPGFNLIVGDNGQGKTNLIEAIGVLTGLRSFRTANQRRIVRHGQSSYSLDGVFRLDGRSVRLQQRVTVGPPLERALTIDGRAVPVEQYLETAPLVALAATDKSLVDGEPSVRRAFLDRFAFLLEPAMYEDVRTYRRLLRQRNAALTSIRDDHTLEAFEVYLARAGAAVVERRRRALSRLAAMFADVYPEVAGTGFPTVTLDYRGERWTGETDLARDEVEKAYLRRYNEHRTRDRMTGFTVDGPHRHDLILRASGRPVRDVLSSGQSKVVVAALRLAMLLEVERTRGDHLPIIVDDIDAELDRVVLERVLRHLGMNRQVVLSSADGERVMGVLTRGQRMRLVVGTCADITTFGE